MFQDVNEVDLPMSSASDVTSLNEQTKPTEIHITTEPLSPEKCAQDPHSSIMTPNTRKRKSRLAQQITDDLRDLQLTPTEQVQVLTLSLKQLGIYDLFQFTRKHTKAERKLTPIETYKAVWNFWQESTLTSRPAKLRLTKRPNIQKGLEFGVPVSIIIQRSQKFYEAQWCIFQNTLKELYCFYLQRYPDHYVSWGTFNALKPFYSRTATNKDVEMCCCKTHLHARWSIKALVKCCENNEINHGDINS